MKRRLFLKNSIAALFFASIKTNNTITQLIQTDSISSLDVLLYKIKNKKGFWFIRGTKYVDIAKNKINEDKYDINTFVPLEIVKNNKANKRRLELWKIHNCGGGPGGGTGFPLDVEKSTNHFKNIFNNEIWKNNFIVYNKSERKKNNATIIARKNALKGIPQKNGLKVLELSQEKRKEIGKKSGQSRLGRKASLEHKLAISNGLKGKSKSENHKNALSQSKKGFKVSEETKNKISRTLSGNGNPMFGKTHSEDIRKKMSLNNKSYHIIRTCPHCNKTIKGNNYFRHHGDRCKLKRG